MLYKSFLIKETIYVLTSAIEKLKIKLDKDYLYGFHVCHNSSILLYAYFLVSFK